MVAQTDKAMFSKRPAKVPGRIMAWALIEGRPLTTSGQWINPLVFALFRLAQATPARKGSDAPIYIIGTGRSGTTILGKLFAMHRDTVFLNEPKAAWHFIHGGEDIIGSYTRQPARILLDAEEATPRRARMLARIYSWAMRWGMAKRVVDKYPELVFRTDFVTRLFPKARFIAILRDGVDTCSSVTQWSRRKGEQRDSEIHDWWGRDSRKWQLLVEQIVPLHPDLAPLQAKLAGTTDHRDRAAVEWIVSMRAARDAARRHPEAILAIRYEDLCANPEPELERMLAHCGLEPDAVFTEYSLSVLSAAELYKPLELMPDLVAPFRAMLADMGYEASLERVVERESERQP